MTQLQTTDRTKAMQPTEALAQPISTVQQFRERIEQLQQVAFICCPFINLDTIPANYLISERRVLVNPDPAARDVYFSALFCEGSREHPKTVALTRKALMRLWVAAGGNLLWSKQVGDSSDSRVVQWSVGGELRQIDGNVVQLIDGKRLDFRDGSDDVRGMSDKQLAGARSHIYELAATKAWLRLIRKAMDVADTYSVEELRKKMFVTYALVPNLDTSDPEIRRMAAAAQLNVVDQVYGRRPTVQIEAHPLPDLDVDGEPLAPEPPEAPFDLGGLPPEKPVAPPPPPPTEIIVCGCPCGDQREVTQGVAEGTLKAVGSIRCQQCYPGDNFNYEAHKHLASLELKSRPDITPATWLASHQR